MAGIGGFLDNPPIPQSRRFLDAVTSLFDHYREERAFVEVPALPLLKSADVVSRKRVLIAVDRASPPRR